MRTCELTTLARHRQWPAGVGLAVALACLVGWTWPQLGHAQPFTITQITNTTGTVDRVRGFGNSGAAINATGTRIAFVSDLDLTPGNPGNADRNREIFLFDTATGIIQITNTTGSTSGPGSFSNGAPSIDATGTRISFVSSRDLTPGNPGNGDGDLEIFLFDTTTGITQITNTGCDGSGTASINAAGTRIAFVSDCDLTPGNPGNADGNLELFLVDTTTSAFTQITNTTVGSTFVSSINAAGTRIAVVSDRDLTPGNPGNVDGNSEIFLFDTTTGTFTQITNTIGGGNDSPSINAAGTRIAFVSNHDLTPGNPGNADGNFEIFLASSGAAPPTPTIPALAGWGMTLLGVLLAGGMVAALRRRLAG